VNSKINRDDFGQLAARQRRADNARIVREQKERIAELEAVLREIADGELLDAVGNRNDNGMQDYLGTPPGGKQIADWLRKIRKVLS
jgi:hypothetical protein